jgi:predicted O-methyltransferase YrrM
MTQETWTAVDNYINQMLVPSDPVLDAVVESSAAAGLPAIAVSPSQGKLLYLLAQIQGARKVLEVGTLAGYSTIWLARALPPGGRVITLEFDPKHAKIATTNIAQAGLSDTVEVRVGPALASLPQIVAEGLGPFDLIFIDADKENNVPYFKWALQLSRPGTVIIVDNVVRDGAVVDPKNQEPTILGIRRLNDFLAAEARVSATAVQNVGSKGYDGFILARVNTAPVSAQA